MSSSFPVNSIVRSTGLGRRHFLASAAAVAAGMGLIGGVKSADAALTTTFGQKGNRKTVTDIDILNFALNSEYLGNEFYQRAVNGVGLSASDTSGVGSRGNRSKPNPATPGTVTGGSQVTFSDPVVAAGAAAIARDEMAHLLFLRTALGKNAVAQPAIDLTNSFTAVALAAGIITTGQTFDAFAGDDNFLLAAFTLEDTEVTAYHGAAPYLKSETNLEAAAGILGTEAYHGGFLRTLIYKRGQTNPDLIANANKISALRATLDGVGHDVGVTSNGSFEIANVDANAVAFARTFQQVLNILYGNTTDTPGGFFPSGLNGLIS